MHRSPVLNRFERTLDEHDRVCPERTVQYSHNAADNHGAEDKISNPVFRQRNLSAVDQPEEIQTEYAQDNRHVLLARHRKSRRDRSHEDIFRLLSLEIIQNADEQNHRKEYQKDIVAQESREVDEAGRYRKEYCGDDGLPSVEISESVYRINQQNGKRPKKRRNNAPDKVAGAEETEHARGHVIQERTVICRIVMIGKNAVI